MAVALVVAAGRGERLGTAVPKAFAMLAGHPMVHWSIAALEEVLAASDDDLEAVESVGAGRAKDIREGLRRLQEINLVDRYLQT